MPCLFRAEALPKSLTHSYLLPNCAHHGSHGHVPHDPHILLLSHGKTGIQAKPASPPGRQPVGPLYLVLYPYAHVCHCLNTLNTHFVFKKIKAKVLQAPFWNFLESLELALDKPLTK